ncbi:hypothetical protein J5N97_013216 [Dioscorea zingiberensis]|uniref:Uncharacterized protein n=1 Tax=Dioscorea zingiberensis TaxID=325984 RepID=A0A9D5CSJ2_9LILI|nr:hypothetical protein J5N97_013216 [Dioscorea zingiberensis]
MVGDALQAQEKISREPPITQKPTGAETTLTIPAATPPVTALHPYTGRSHRSLWTVLEAGEHGGRLPACNNVPHLWRHGTSRQRMMEKGTVRQLPPAGLWEAQSRRLKHRKPSSRHRGHPPECGEKEQTQRRKPETTEKKMKPTNTSVTGKIEEYHISLALDSEMMLGKEELKSYIVATVKEVREGIMDRSTISAAVREVLGGD